MSYKKVNVYKVDLNNDFSFEDILLNSEFQAPMEIDGYKTSELKFVDPIQHNGRRLIRGLFVTTQRKNIPPAHTPGEEDFSAIHLEGRQGLSYPNTILYDTSNSSLYLESNRAGLTSSKIEKYFNEHPNSTINGLNVSLSLILRQNAYNKVRNMVSIKSLEAKIANPTLINERRLAEGPIGDYAKVSANMGATKSMHIKLTAKILDGGGLSKNSSLAIANVFQHIMCIDDIWSKSNKLVIKGKDSDDKEEAVNFLVDKIEDYFILDDPDLATNLLTEERKQGIIDVYDRKCEEVSRII